MSVATRRALPWLVAAAAVVPFLPAIGAPFLSWDDSVNFAENPFWRGFGGGNLRWMLTTFHGGPWQPLSWMSCGLDFLLWGASAPALRATNLALHAASSAVFFLLVRELAAKGAPSSSEGDRDAVAAFASLVWAVHPLRVESVVWVTERRDVLSGLFYLLSLLSYVRAPGRTRLPLLFFLLALLSKASTVTLPLTLMILDRWPLKRRALAEKTPYLAAAAAAGLVGLAGQRAAASLAGFEAAGAGLRLAVSLHSLGWYALKTVAPLGLSPYHAVPRGFGLSSPSALFGAAAAGLLAAAAYLLRRREPGVAAGAAQYAVALLPLLGLVRFGHHLTAERYSYLPGLGLACAAGAVLHAARRRAAARPVAAAVVLVLAALCARSSSWWRSDEALWSRAIAADPAAPLPRANLAGVYRRAGRLDEARALEESVVALDPRAARELNNLGGDALAAGRFDEAEALLRRALDARPDLPEVRRNLAAVDNNRGNAALAAGRAGDAERLLTKAAATDPTWAVPSYNRGNALTVLGRHREAAEAYDAAARLDPAMADAFVNGGNARFRLGELEAAVSRYEKALSVAPRNELARRNLDEARRAIADGRRRH